jgi:hypothetical protein
MEAILSSRTSLLTRATRRHSPPDGILRPWICVPPRRRVESQQKSRRCILDCGAPVKTSHPARFPPRLPVRRTWRCGVTGVGDRGSSLGRDASRRSGPATPGFLCRFLLHIETGRPLPQLPPYSFCSPHRTKKVEGRDFRLAPEILCSNLGQQTD